MTMDRIGLKELVEKGSDADLLREMIAFVTARMMDMEVESLTGAAPWRAIRGQNEQPQRLPRAHLGDKGGQRAAGDPQASQGQLFPLLPGARRASEKALVAVIQEAYVQGVSTRSVDELVKAMGMTGISKSPGLAAVRRHRRAREDLPQPPP